MSTVSVRPLRLPCGKVSQRMQKHRTCALRSKRKNKELLLLRSGSSRV